MKAQYKRIRSMDELNTDGCLHFLEAFLKRLSEEFTVSFVNHVRFPEDEQLNSYYLDIRKLIQSQYFRDLTNLDGTEVVESLERITLKLIR